MMVGPTSEVLPSNLDALSVDNAKTLQRLFGGDFVVASAHDFLSSNTVISANETLAEEVYGNDIASLVKRHDFDAVVRVRDEIAESISLPPEALEGINIDDLGIVVVRPELLSNVDACRKLLAINGFSTVLDRNIRVNLDQYISLYPHGIAVPETYYDFPTRTLNYVGRDARLLVVTKGRTSDEPSVSATLADSLKGTQGTYAPRTLRGEVAYRALAGYVGEDANMLSKVALALDPISAYRKIVRGDIPTSSIIHNDAEIPFLFFAGQGVHVPDDSEIARDLRILCDESDIQTVIESLKGDV